MLVDQIECSDDLQGALELCRQKAKDNGYTLEYETIENSSEDTFLLLSLHYEVKLPALRFSKKEKGIEGVIQGYVR